MDYETDQGVDCLQVMRLMDSALGKICTKGKRRIKSYPMVQFLVSHANPANNFAKLMSPWHTTQT